MTANLMGPLLHTGHYSILDPLLTVILLKTLPSTRYHSWLIEEETEVKGLVQDCPATKKQGQDETPGLSVS